MDLQKKKKSTINEQINKILSTTQGKVYFTVGLTLLLMFLMIVFAILPSYTSIIDQLSVMDKKNKYLIDLEAKLTQINLLNNQYEKYLNAITIFDLYFGQKPNNELIGVTVHQVVTSNDCTFVNINFQELNKSEVLKDSIPGLGIVKVGMNMYCPYDKIPVVYNELTNYVIPMAIYSLSAVEIGGTVNLGLEANSFNVSMQGEYYYWPAAQNIK